MAKVRFLDTASRKNRDRVKKHRDFKKLKAIHDKQIYERMKLFNSAPHDRHTSNTHELSDFDKTSEIKDKLKRWIVHHRITQSALSDLLVILIFAGLHFLPKDARTFMGTPVKVPIDRLSNGQLFYYGIKTCMENVLNKFIVNIRTCTLDFNFDGFPISKSSSKQFWPILSSIRGKLKL